MLGEKSFASDQTITVGDIRTLFQVAGTGPLLEAELMPLNSKGKLRITYNWLYSALNCDPNDSTSWLWVISKIDETHASLSPQQGYGGRTLYASDRDDWDDTIQVQAPRSADWIVAVGRDEIFQLEYHDLLTVSFKGFNGKYLQVNSDPDNHGGHQGYRIRSIATETSQDSLWFLGVSRVLQNGLQLVGK